MKEYKPSKRTEKILNVALAIVEEQPYRPTLRFLFYRLLSFPELGLSKKSYTTFKSNWTSKARKRYWNGWKPNTLADDSRQAIVRGVPTKAIAAEPDRIKEQKNYVEIWFESEAMLGQFWYYTQEHHVTLVPFKGDAGIDYKWEIAKRLEERSETYGKPIVILYFGDCDTKGKIIPESALKDICAWCSVEFEFIHCGLTPKQVEQYKLSDRPAEPGQYQWAALDNKHAEKIIMENLKKYWKCKK